MSLFFKIWVQSGADKCHKRNCKNSRVLVEVVCLESKKTGGLIEEKRSRASSRVTLRELDITGFIQLIVCALLGGNITVLGSPQVFDERIS